MKLELTRIDPIRTANIVALIQAAVMLVMVAIMLPIMLVIFAIGVASRDESAIGALVPLVLIIFYPIIGLIFGWIFGLLSAWVYNLVTRWVGGLLIEITALDGWKPGPDVVSSPGP